MCSTIARDTATRNSCTRTGSNPGQPVRDDATDLSLLHQSH